MTQRPRIREEDKKRLKVWYREQGTPKLDEKADLRGRFCEKPFDAMDLQQDYGDAGICYACCPSWLPTPIGDLRTQSVDEVFNSPEAQAIRASILDGSFSYCNHELCPKIQNGTLPKVEDIQEPRHRRHVAEGRTRIDVPAYINFAEDRTCNLSCPSCRTKKITMTSGPQFEVAKQVNEKMMSYLQGLEDPGHPIMLCLTGSGDPFASSIYRDLLFSFDGARHPHLRFILQTNGVALTPITWRRMSKLHGNIQTLLVSVDAAEPDTYDIVRRDGNWDILMNNLEFLSERRLAGDFSYLRLDFVVQDHNFREMPRFVELARSMPGMIDNVYFSIVTNWGTWSFETFRRRAIWKSEHPDHPEFLEVLRAEELRDRAFVDLGNVSHWYRQANEAS